jgi:hypothetical protein
VLQPEVPGLIPEEVSGFSIDLFLPSALWCTAGFSLLRDMSIRIFVVKVPSALEAENLSPAYEADCLRYLRSSSLTILMASAAS